MICKCGKTVDLSDRRLTSLYLSGKKKVIIPCKECGEQYKVKIFVDVNSFIDGVDIEQGTEEIEKVK